MTIGQRILAAREEAGLSQRQAAGEHMTRNMLSCLEHDKAKPSLDTLLYLSRTLGKSVGYFLGENDVAGYPAMVQARSAYDDGEYRGCLAALSQVPPGEVLDRERTLLELLAKLALAEQALGDGRVPYARELAAQASTMECPYWTPELRRRLAILSARVDKSPGLVAAIADDGVLLLKAEAALAEKRYSDAERYLSALDHRDGQWNYLMGEALFGQQRYENALPCYHAAEEAMPQAVRRKLQLCYAARKDFERAYYYATLEE